MLFFAALARHQSARSPLLCNNARGAGRSRVGQHDAPSLIPGPIGGVFFVLLSHEEHPILLSLVVCDDKHPGMLGTPRFFDHKFPARLGLVLKKLLPVLGRPTRSLAAPEPEIDLLELLLSDLFDDGRVTFRRICGGRATASRLFAS